MSAFPPIRRVQRPLVHGFTSIELMVTIAIVAILAGLAAPSFNPLLQRWRVRNGTEAMVSALYFARSEALKRGGNIQIKKTPDSTDGCTQAPTNEDWGCGWGVYSADDSGTLTLLRSFAVPTRIQVSIKDSSGAIQIDRWGAVTGVSAKGVSVTPVGGDNSSPAAQGICVAAGGRVKVIGNPPC
ncbi:GspH/FimT family pseudopilin [Delftia tsuruhatensis]